MSDDIINKIAGECEEQFRFQDDVERLIHTYIIPKMNEYLHIDKDKEQKEVDRAITFLFCQEIRNYSSSMLLVRNGYSTNALVNLRQMVEIIMELNYILEDKNDSYQRAVNYLREGNKLSKSKKCKCILNKRLYEAYKVLCDHAHANYKALCKNKMENYISIGPNDILVNETSVFVNSLFYYSLETLLVYYNIKDTVLEEISIPKDTKQQITNYKKEKEVTELLFDMLLKPLGLTDEEISSLEDEYKDYLLKKK